eukprot:15463537-Alexandrium_andersonii.AAC.1
MCSKEPCRWLSGLWARGSATDRQKWWRPWEGPGTRRKLLWAFGVGRRSPANPNALNQPGPNG